MQEMAGKFEPVDKKEIDKLIDEFQNIKITCSKSGKFTKELYIEFLKTCHSSYVKKNKFLLIIDSWERQTDLALYNEIFE